MGSEMSKRPSALESPREKSPSPCAHSPAGASRIRPRSHVAFRLARVFMFGPFERVVTSQTERLGATVLTFEIPARSVSGFFPGGEETKGAKPAGATNSRFRRPWGGDTLRRFARGICPGVPRYHARHHPAPGGAAGGA